MTDYEQQILDFYDLNPSRQQITSLAKMYKDSEDNIKQILQSYGRVIPLADKKPRIKTVTKEEPEMEKLISETLPMPEYVKEILMDKMDELEVEIRILEDELDAYKQKYKTLADYIKK